MKGRQYLLNFVWGIATRIANRLQRHKILGSKSRAFFRHIGHLLVPPPNTELCFICPTGIKMVTPLGFRGARSYSAGTYEEYLTNLVSRTLQPAMTAVDVGALVGYYTLIFAKLVGRQGHVFAFEPEPVSFGYLQRNIELNSFVNIEATPAAVADCSGNRLFIPSCTRSIGPIGGTLATQQDNPKEGINVPIISLDDFFSSCGWPRIDLVKIDVDGAEPLVLKGMNELNNRNPHLQLVMEIDPNWMHQQGNTYRHFIDMLLRMDFKAGYIAEQNSHFSLIEGFPVSKDHYNVLFTKF